MAWIRVVKAGEGDRVLEEFYASMNLPAGMTPGSPYDEMTLNPPALVAFQEFQRTLRHGPSELTRLQREMIATLVSADNHCLL